MTPINEVVARKVEQSIARGNSVNYICQHFGVGKSYVYKMIGGDIDRYEAYREWRKGSKVKRRKPEEPRNIGTHYKKALPPEQWHGAEVLLVILQRLKALRVKRPEIDLDRLRAVWQKKMDEVVN